MARLEDIQAGGGEKKVHALKDDPHVVRAVFRSPSRKDAYATFLRGRLAYLFFPDDVPRPLKFGQDDAGQYYMDIERVPLDALHLQRQIERNMSAASRGLLETENNEHELTYYRLKEMNQRRERGDMAIMFNRAGLPLDTDDYNWSMAENTVRNLDLRAAWIGPASKRTFDREKIEAHIATLDSERKRDATDILNELLKLEE